MSPDDAAVEEVDFGAAPRRRSRALGAVQDNVAPIREARTRQQVAEELAAGLNPLREPQRFGPIVTADQGIYTVAWSAPEYVSLDFDLITTDRRSGETSAEVAIHLTGLDSRLLHRTRLNLLSTVAQDRLAKYLAGRTQHLALEWPELVAEACQQVLTLHRAGEPAILLRDAPDPPGAGEPLVPPLLVEDGTTILFGDGGTGKSHLALGLAASLHTGRSLVAGLEVATTRRVGYIDWEWTPYPHRRRLERLGWDDGLPDLVYIPCRGPLRDEQDRLRRFIREHRLEYLVLDSVALAAGGEPESAEVAIAFFSSLRALALPNLCVAHVTNAAAKSSADRPFGSAFWHNSARSTWYVRRAEASGPGRLALGLYNRKANDAPLAAPIGLAITFEEDRTTITRSDVRDEPDLDAQRPIRHRIADQLRGGQMLTHDLAEGLGESVDAVRMALRRGLNKQFVRTNRPDGIEQWGLLSHD